jgi:hypothetical protein
MYPLLILMRIESLLKAVLTNRRSYWDYLAQNNLSAPSIIESDEEFISNSYNKYSVLGEELI